jgi:Uma2 family endonuclease
MVVAQRLPTLEQFLCLPERKPALEYGDGVVTRKVSPKGRHSALQDELVERFNAGRAVRGPQARLASGQFSRAPRA